VIPYPYLSYPQVALRMGEAVGKRLVVVIMMVADLYACRGGVMADVEGG